MRNRLFRLLAALAAVAVLFVITRGWRRRLLEESARSRRVIAAVEQAQAAREQREAREKGLAAALQSHPGLVEVRLELAQLRWSEAGPAAEQILLLCGGSGEGQPRAAVPRRRIHDPEEPQEGDRPRSPGQDVPWIDPHDL